MPRRIRQIDVYLPLNYNDGSPIPLEEFQSLEIQLLSRFGGITSTHRKFPLQGIWRSEGIVYRDEVVIFGAMDFSKRTDFEMLRYLQSLKSRLKKRFDQLEILITLQEMTAI
jgi:hypothetical protein